jgi:plasmid stabilization system protein ParE
MSYRIRFTRKALEDLDKLYDFLLPIHVEAADRATAAIRKSIASLGDFSFGARKADPENPFLRELLIPFGSAGYVALFAIEDDTIISILAVRHQREEDYH